MRWYFVYVLCTFRHRDVGVDTMYMFFAPSDTELRELILYVCSLHLLAPSCRNWYHMYVLCTFWHRFAGVNTMYMFFASSFTDLREGILCIYSLHLLKPCCRRSNYEYFLCTFYLRAAGSEIMNVFFALSDTLLQGVKLCTHSFHLLAPSDRRWNYVYIPSTYWHPVAGPDTMYTFLAPSSTELPKVKACIHSFHLLAPSCGKWNYMYVYIPFTFWHRVAVADTIYMCFAPSGTELQEVILCICSLHLLAPNCRRWYYVCVPHTWQWDAGGETKYTYAERTHIFTSCRSVPEDATLETFRWAYRFPRINTAGLFLRWVILKINQ